MKNIISILVLCFTFLSASSQDSKGTEFWIGFSPNHEPSTFQVYLSSDVSTNATVTIPGLTFTQNVAITAGVVSTVTLPNSVTPSYFSVSNLGVHITSNDEISVYGLNAKSASTDAFLAFPKDALGNSYYIMSYEQNLGLSSQGLIVATEDNTTVTITSAFTAGGFTQGVPQNVLLDKGEVYLLGTSSNGADMTGTKIESNHPVAVFGGNECVQVPTGNTYCDHIVSQIQPNTSWGKIFYSAPLATRLGGDRFKILAQTNSTTININGAFAVSLNAGESYETVLSAGNKIEASEPILVAQFSHSTSFDGVLSDPFMLIVPPSDQYLPSYLVSTVDMIHMPSTQVNYLNVISPNSNTGSVLVNGVGVASWTAIGTSGLSYAQINVPNGQHSISSTLPIGLYMYGFAAVESYGYVGGQSFSPVATVSSFTLDLQQSVAYQAQEKCVKATVLDQNNNPVVGVKVDFDVIGTNAQTSFGNTNANGVFEFCYNVCLPGLDTIVASIAGLSDSTLITVLPSSLSVTPATATINVGTQQCAMASVLDGSNQPVENAAVNFDVLGANAMNQIIMTDASGIASFCYTPTNSGSDTIAISAGCTDGDVDTVFVTVNGGVTSPCAGNAAFTLYGLKAFWVNGGASDPAVFYQGVSQTKIINVKATGGTGPYSYAWSNSQGYQMKNASGTKVQLFEPQGPSWVICDITDIGAGCTFTDSVFVDFSSAFYCGDASNYWKLKVCEGGVSSCMTWGQAKAALLSGTATLGDCPVLKTQWASTSSKIALYPNPANSIVKMTIPVAFNADGVITIIDINGRIVYSESISLTEGAFETTMDVSDLSNGVYTVQVISNKQQFVERMIIQK